jgi:hypothetical protein
MKRLIAAALALVIAPLAEAQIPRTANGHPDFQGVWENQFWTGLERPSGVSGLALDRAEGERLLAEEAEARVARASLNQTYGLMPPRVWAMVRGESRSSMVTAPPDGRLPLTPLGRSLRPAGPSKVDNPEERSAPERCLGSLGMAPLMVASENNFRRFVQTPGYLMIHTEESNHARIISLAGGPAPPEAMRSRQGHSAGRWEGDTLVVETTHIDGNFPLRGGNRSLLLVGAGSRIVERFSLVAPHELLYQFTVNDPNLYAAPWSAEYSMTRSSARMFESACHEGNYALANMLSGGRQTDGAGVAKP